MNDPLKALNRVVQDWNLLNYLLIVIFFPLSLGYVVFRMIQEIDKP